METMSEKNKINITYDKAKNMIVGSLALSIRGDWNYIGDRQEAIQELYGKVHPEASDDGRYYRDDWDGPYGDPTFEEWQYIKKKYPGLYKYTSLITYPDQTNLISPQDQDIFDKVFYNWSDDKPSQQEIKYIKKKYPGLQND